jgi:type VI secretion system secreted protein VgrG
MPAAYLKIGEDLLKDAILVSVEITQELNQHWWCKVECRQTEDQRFPTEQCLGQDIQVLTYDESGAENVVFDGFIFDVELTYEVWGSYTAQLTAVTRSYKMDHTTRKAYYLAKTLDQVAQELAGYAGLTSSVKGPSKKPLNYMQWGESDFDFLNRLVDDYGCWLRPNSKGVEIFNSFQEGTKLQWRDEAGLLKFKTKGTLGQPSFNGAHYDHHAMKSDTYTGVSDDAQFYNSIAPLVDAVKTQSKKVMPSGYVHQRARVMTLDDYQTVLKKESVRAIGGNIIGHGESRNQQMLPGNTVQIDGTLDAQGMYGVIKVVHRWTATGYVNEFWCTPWKDYTNPDPPEANLWYGLVPARVVANNDPKKMGRIQVQYYWQDDGNAYWARMVTPHAGSDRGFMFMPEVGDEVVVGFEDGDLERAVVLGCLWNGVDQAPRQGFWNKAEDVSTNSDLQENDIKRIVTKSGHRLQFVDKQGKESIALATPKYLKLSMIEKTDETGRSMITLHSENGDIFLSAPNGRIHFLSKYVSKEVGNGTQGNGK